MPRRVRPSESAKFQSSRAGRAPQIEAALAFPPSCHAPARPCALLSTAAAAAARQEWWPGAAGSSPCPATAHAASSTRVGPPAPILKRLAAGVQQVGAGGLALAAGRAHCPAAPACVLGRLPAMQQRLWCPWGVLGLQEEAGGIWSHCRLSRAAPPAASRAHSTPPMQRHSSWEVRDCPLASCLSKSELLRCSTRRSVAARRAPQHTAWCPSTCRMDRARRTCQGRAPCRPCRSGATARRPSA